MKKSILIAIILLLFVQTFTSEKEIEYVEENKEVFYTKELRVQVLEGRGNTPASGYASLDRYLEDNPVKEEQEQKQYIDYFVVTYYCGCQKCCGNWTDNSESNATGALGKKLTPYYSIAVDPKVIPLGTKVYDMLGNEYRAEDTGSAIKGNKIDLFVGNHNEALKLGKKVIPIKWEAK